MTYVLTDKRGTFHGNWLRLRKTIVIPSLHGHAK
jgi:hypothetical protein